MVPEYYFGNLCFMLPVRLLVLGLHSTKMSSFSRNSKSIKTGPDKYWICERECSRGKTVSGECADDCLPCGNWTTAVKNFCYNPISSIIPCHEKCLVDIQGNVDVVLKEPNSEPFPMPIETMNKFATMFFEAKYGIIPISFRQRITFWSQCFERFRNGTKQCWL